MKRDKFRRSNIKNNTKFLWIEELEDFGPCGLDYGEWYWSSKYKNIIQVVKETILFKLYEQYGHGIKLQKDLILKTLNDSNFEELMRKISFLIFDIKVENNSVAVENWIKELNALLKQAETGIEMKVFILKDDAVRLLEEHMGKKIDSSNKELKKLFIEDVMM